MLKLIYMYYNIYIIYRPLVLHNIEKKKKKGGIGEDHFQLQICWYLFVEVIFVK